MSLDARIFVDAILILIVWEGIRWFLKKDDPNG